MMEQLLFRCIINCSSQAIIDHLHTVWLMQIDTPGKALLLGISLFYVGVVLVVPTANVFYQVGYPCIYSCCLVQALL